MPRLDASHWNSASYRDDAFRLIDLGVGGFGIFIGGLEETAAMLEALQHRAGGNLLFGADYEYGLPMRLTNGGIAMPRAMALGRGDVEQTEQVAAAVAREMRALGVHWNWAPVADVNSEPANPIVNVRAFGEEAKHVALHVSAWVRGTQAEGIAACIKHAPGHGATTTDSHQDLPTIAVSASRASSREFVPFREGVANNVASVMVGHLLVPFLDSVRPASLSSAVVNGLIRDTWGFNGVVVTDALDMGAITKRYGAGDATVRAIAAGNDVALMPSNAFEGIAALQKAFENGAITPGRLDASLERIRQLRAMKKTWPKSTTVNQSAHAQLALNAAQRAIHLQGDRSLLPITKWNHAAVLGVVGEDDAQVATQWFQILAQATEMNIDFGYINGDISQTELIELKRSIDDADILVFGMFSAASAFRSKTPGIERIPEIMLSLANGRPVIAVVCGSPYGSELFPANLAIHAYSDTTPSLAASVLTLTGKQQPTVSTD